MARDPGFNTVTTSASVLEDIVAVEAPYDALAAPTNDDLISSSLLLLPQGAAWGTPDGEALPLSSGLARFVRVMLDPFVWLHWRAWGLAREATVQGVDELLPEWEADYGLPDNCAFGVASAAERLRALEAKVSAKAIISPSDFIRLAASYGFIVTIEEPAMFECGFSECGGEHTLGDVRQEIYWIVYVSDLAIDYFRVGESEVGYVPLFSFGEAERLLCILRRLAPAWSLPVLSPFADASSALDFSLAGGSQYIPLVMEIT
tara:strand:- start:10956 stop:11738 length:783 start_codon:yes stop_codon:yes gene_type:complete